MLLRATSLFRAAASLPCPDLLRPCHGRCFLFSEFFSDMPGWRRASGELSPANRGRASIQSAWRAPATSGWSNQSSLVFRYGWT